MVELDNQAQVIIEVQLAKQVFFINRIWAYLCKQVNDNIERLKQNEKEQLAIYKKLPPVYVAAIVDQNYFDGDEAISTFLIKEETRNTELKMYVENNAKDIPLLKIVFLELKKYKENLNNDYKKIRWLEFFGNKQYTSEPDEVLVQADNLLNLRNWSEEEKRMYDEATRQQDHYWASLAYAQEEGRAEGRAEGMRLGIEQGIERGIGLGIEQGIEQAVITLLRNGYISEEVAAAQLKVNIEDLDKYL